jgi:hypothetical protein
LKRKGYLTQDDRGHGHAGYWRIRFRIGERVRTVYLGRDANLVEHVRIELSALQEEQRQTRQLTKVASESKKILRTAKKKLKPLIGSLGFHFHGSAMRKNRQEKRIES